MRHVIRLFAVICCAVVGLDATEAKRVALVIGNAEYTVQPVLKNPVNDATAVAEAFEKLNFDKVILRKNLGLEGFRTALVVMSREALGAEIGVVFFAGNGVAAGGRNYLMPVDAKLGKAGNAGDLDLEAIALDAVLQQLAGVAKLQLVILDACNSSAFTFGQMRGVGKGLARIDPVRSDTLVVLADKHGNALDGTGRHSPFTAALLKHLATPGLEIGMLFRRVRADVLAATAGSQEPYVYGMLGGEEIFLHPSGR